MIGTGSWERKKLGEIADFQNGGAWNESEYCRDGIAVVRVTNCKEGSVDLSDCKWLPETSLEKYRKHILRTGDLVIATVGSHPTQPGSVVGRSSVVPKAANETLLNQNAVRLRAIAGVCDQKFLNSLSFCAGFRQYIAAHARGAASQVRMSLELLKEMQLAMPPLPIQHRIAEILSAYDDLIENNTRRIAILEEMARRLYEEWFVHFRFPGHEDVEFDGDLPRGWATKHLQDVAGLVMGQSPKSEFYNQSGEGLTFHQGVSDFGPFFPTDRLFCTVEGRIAEEGDILVSVRAPVGRINIATKKIVIGRGLCAIRSLTGHQNFLLAQLRDRFAEEDSMGSGAIFNAVTKKDMQTLDLVCPPLELSGRFEKLSSPFWCSIRNLSDKNANLRAQRDLLLPKLVSGEIDVSGAEAALEAAE